MLRLRTRRLLRRWRHSAGHRTSSAHVRAATCNHTQHVLGHPLHASHLVQTLGIALHVWEGCHGLCTKGLLLVVAVAAPEGAVHAGAAVAQALLGLAEGAGWQG